jgi:exosortase/archaeosortase family protein
VTKSLVDDAASTAPDESIESASPRAAPRLRGLSPPLTTLWGRLAMLVVVTGVAFRYSLSTLIQSLSVDSPLAYLGLVPFLALALGIALARAREEEPEVHDRLLDRIIGVPLVVIALLVMVVLPAQMSTFFWLWRIDLLALPLFVAGVVVWLFGSRVFFRVLPAVLLLFLAWPIPFRMALARFLDGFTNLATQVVTEIVKVVPLATPVPNVEAGFLVPTPSGSFKVVVATECSGANGLLGFLLIAGVLMILAKGSWRRKLAWLAAGSVVVWVFNLFRILSIFLVGRLWGERVAIDGFHPYVGLVTFSMATLVAVWFMPRFGIGFGGGRRSTSDLARSVRTAVPHIRACGVGLLAVAVVAGAFNADLRRVNPVASALGAPRVIPFGELQQPAPGYDAQVVDHFDWAARFFGIDSDWTRYQLTGGGTDSLGSDLPVTADVITTTQLELFNDFGVEACYRFHGYDVEGVQQVDLGRGQVGSMLSWHDPVSPIRWTALYWFWPVAGHTGQPQRYQRIVLLLNSSTNARVWSPGVSGRPTTEVGMTLEQALQGKSDSSQLNARDQQLRSFLRSLGRAIVASSAPEHQR